MAQRRPVSSGPIARRTAAPASRRSGGAVRRTTSRGTTSRTSTRRTTSARRTSTRATARRGSQLRRPRLQRARGAKAARAGADRQLQRFRQATILAVAVTAMILLLVPSAAQDTDTLAADTLTAGDAVEDVAADSVLVPRDAGEVATQAATEAQGVLRGMWTGFVALLPKLAVAVGILLLVWGLTRLIRPAIKTLARRFEKGAAVAALVNTGLWILGVGAAVSVVAGNLGALVGSLGLVGLALSWSLQGPIESFTGWLLNSFKGYFHEGDRIAVGDVVGDVYRIDVLNTLVWEIGGPGSPSGIEAEQPTGRLITFPNSEIVSGTVVNYSRDFPFVWDEVAVAVAAESDLTYAAEVVKRVAVKHIGEAMQGPARTYAARLKDTPLDERVADTPEVFITLTDWGANLVVRYLVEIRSKRRVKTDLGVALVRELNETEHAGKILAAYPRQQIQLVGPGGEPEPWRMGPAPG